MKDIIVMIITISLILSVGISAVFFANLIFPDEPKITKNLLEECQNMKGTPQFEKKEEWREGEKTIYHYEYIGCYIKN